MPGVTVTTLTYETIDLYRQWCIGRGRSENTVKGYASDLREFVKATGEVSQEEYEELAQSWLNLYRAKLSPKTTARRLTSLRGFARWAGWGPVLEDYIAPTPGKTIPHPIAEGAEGVRAMIERAKNYEQAAIVALGGFVGCRISESLSLRTYDFDTQTMQVTIRGKGDKTRVVPVSPEAWVNIQSSWVLAHSKSDNKLISYKDRFARQLVTNLGVRAGLKRKVSSHDLRATFATEALDRTGGNIRVVQELLGHESVETTEIYTGVSMSAMREAVQF